MSNGNQGLLGIYSESKKRQQAMRNKLLDLMGQQIRMRTQEQFYRTRPREVAMEEYYKERGLSEKAERERWGLLKPEEQEKGYRISLGLEPREVAEKPKTLEEIKWESLAPEEQEKAIRIRYGLEAGIGAEKTPLEELEDTRKTIEEKEKIADLTNEQRILLNSTKETVKDLDDYIKRVYPEGDVDENDPTVNEYLNIIKNNGLLLKGIDPELYEKLSNISLRTPEQEQKWRMQYNLMHPVAPIPLLKGLNEKRIEPGGLLGTKTEEAKFLDIPAGAKSTGRTSGGKPVWVLPNGDYWVQD